MVPSKNPSKKALPLKNLLRTLLRSVRLHDPLGVRTKNVKVLGENQFGRVLRNFVCPKVSFADFSLRRVFWFRKSPKCMAISAHLVFASTFLTTLSVLLSFLLSTSLSICRGLSLLPFSVIYVKINFSILLNTFFGGGRYLHN